MTHLMRKHDLTETLYHKSLLKAPPMRGMRGNTVRGRRGRLHRGSSRSGSSVPMRGCGGSRGAAAHGFPWQLLPVVANPPSDHFAPPLPLVQSQTQQTSLTHVEVEVREGMSGRPDGGAGGAQPLLPPLPPPHGHRHPLPPLPPGSKTHILSRSHFSTNMCCHQQSALLWSDSVLEVLFVTKTLFQAEATIRFQTSAVDCKNQI